MNNDNTYYDCKCKHYDGVIIICKTCEEWASKIEKAIEEHKVDEYTTVSNSKRWVNSKLKKKKILINKSCFFA